MKYEVAVREVYKTIIAVEADTEEQAKQIAANILATGDDLPDNQYDYTLEQDEWQVWEA